MSEKFSIRLLGPAKVLGQRRQARDVVEVDRNILDHLIAAGVVDDRPAEGAAEQVAAKVIGDDGSQQVFTRAEWQEVIETRARAIAGGAFDGALGKLEAEAKDIMASIEALEAERDAAIARAVEAEAHRDLLQGRVLELQAQTTQGTEDAPVLQDTEATKSTPPKKARGSQKG